MLESHLCKAEVWVSAEMIASFLLGQYLTPLFCYKHQVPQIKPFFHLELHVLESYCLRFLQQTEA